MINESYTTHEKRTIIAKLYRFSNAVRPMKPKEVAYISHVAGTFGFDESELQEIREADENEHLIMPKGERERMSIMYYLMFLARVDGVINENEESALISEGMNMGLSPILVYDLINVLRKNKRGSIPPKEMLFQIKKYLN